jgi:hypothetical protein
MNKKLLSMATYELKLNDKQVAEVVRIYEAIRSDRDLSFEGSDDMNLMEAIDYLRQGGLARTLATCAVCTRVRKIMAVLNPDKKGKSHA